jgi:hypothetical protein
MEQKCGRCKWFVKEDIPLEPGAVTYQIERLVEDKDIDIKGGGRAAAYGKCRATFIDSNGNEQRYDFGTYTNFSCRAVDESNPPKLLFTED